MADGLFDSDSSSSSSTSFYDFSSGRGTPLTLGALVAIVVVALLVVGLFVALAASERAAERELDRTKYVEAASNNLDRWLGTRAYEIVPSSLWMEDGSSHRDNYHCKGGQFQTTDGQNVTYCCSVVPGDNPPCMVIP